jgi:hypothetical protein
MFIDTLWGVDVRSSGGRWCDQSLHHWSTGAKVREDAPPHRHYASPQGTLG